jgi:hypothetical protein
MQLGGSPNISDKFPDKPKGMHWQTYQRLRRAHDVAEALAADLVDVGVVACRSRASAAGFKAGIT